MTTITREHLEQALANPTKITFNYGETLELARIALASLTAEPVAGEARFKEEHHWSPCTAAHVAMVLENPADWPNYEVRYLYAYPALTDAERAELQAVKAQLKAAQAHITELEAAPPAPVGPYEEPVPVMPDFPGRVMTQRECWQAGKAFGMAEGRKSAVIPDEKCDYDGTTTSEFDHGWNACRAAMLNGGKS
ncbi:hypothetical protein [Citrobacter sp. CK205]|uniref:hypothetical protein n=1 Tax=Citrobacter sp. CK205 TaxID=2985114 RepID=UPI0025769C19|nr:hypothetical protein [Citrobacter sp. CK205]MDM3132224.1 hypothetical protein [Citrobacter sp. CK205]